MYKEVNESVDLAKVTLIWLKEYFFEVMSEKHVA